jgi:hypothetical protein
VKEFWNTSGLDFAKKIARDKLEEVGSLSFVEILISR